MIDEACNRIFKVGLHADILKNLSWETLSVASLKDPKLTSKRELVIRQMNMLHDLVRVTASARDALRQAQAVDIVQRFRDVTGDKVIFVPSFITQDAALDQRMDITVRVRNSKVKCRLGSTKYRQFE